MRKIIPFPIPKKTMAVGSALLVRWAGTGVQLLLNIILGRLLGSNGVGVYYLYISSLNLISNIGGGGYPQYTLRTVAVLDGQDRTAETNQFVKKSFLAAFGLTAVLALFVLVFSVPLSGLLLETRSRYYVLDFAAIGSLFLILTKVLTGALKAKGQPNLALGLENSAVPLGLLLFVVAAFLFSIPFTIHLVFWGHVLFVIIVFLIVVIYWWKKYHSITPQQDEARKPVTNRRSLSAFWGLTLLNTAYGTLPIILLPQFASISEVGQFGVAQRLVTLASVILVVLNTIYSPKFARHYVEGNRDALRHDLRESQKYSFLIYLPFIMIFLLFAKPILSIFGSEFTGGSLYLWILAIGQLVNSATGLVGNFLNMTDREGLELRLSIAGVGLLVVLIFVGGFLYGAVGVALAYAFTVAAKNAVTFIISRSVLKQIPNLSGGESS